MITLTQGSHPQLGEQQRTQEVAGCFPVFRDQVLTHFPIVQVQVRAANREKRFSGRKP